MMRINIRGTVVAVSVALLGALAAAPQAYAAPITFDASTSNAAWTASYSGFSGIAFHYSCGIVDCISITSTGLPNGAFVGGGTAADFTGTWTATLNFFLPANAVNVTYTYASIGVDDRATLSLNGATVGTFFIFNPQISGTITSPASFVLGGMNTLTLSARTSRSDSGYGKGPILERLPNGGFNSVSTLNYARVPTAQAALSRSND